MIYLGSFKEEDYANGKYRDAIHGAKVLGYPFTKIALSEEDGETSWKVWACSPDEWVEKDILEACAKASDQAATRKEEFLPTKTYKVTYREIYVDTRWYDAASEEEARALMYGDIESGEYDFRDLVLEDAYVEAEEVKNFGT